MYEKLEKDVNLSWDPMRRTELAFKESVVYSKFIQNALILIHETMSISKIGI